MKYISCRRHVISLFLFSFCFLFFNFSKIVIIPHKGVLKWSFFLFSNWYLRTRAWKHKGCVGFLNEQNSEQLPFGLFDPSSSSKAFAAQNQLFITYKLPNKDRLLNNVPTRNRHLSYFFVIDDRNNNWSQWLRVPRGWMLFKTLTTFIQILLFLLIGWFYKWCQNFAKRLF